MQKRYKYPLIAIGVAFAAAAAGFCEVAVVRTNQASLIEKQAQGLSPEASACLKSTVNARSQAVMFNRYADRASYLSTSIEKSLREEAQSFEQDAVVEDIMCSMQALGRVMKTLEDKAGPR